jgi:hypothetical protein
VCCVKTSNGIDKKVVAKLEDVLLVTIITLTLILQRQGMGILLAAHPPIRMREMLQ